jgi:hypothetical protein
LCYYTSEMSCPYFRPLQPHHGKAVFPLGDFWTGLCASDPAAPRAPLEQSPCNLGYARGRCALFPEGDGPDAVRFTIASHGDAGIGVYYVMERDHEPFAHGPLDYSFTSGIAPGENAALAIQAGAYVASYLHRKQEA